MSIKQAAENAIFSYPKDTGNPPSNQGVADLFRNVRYTRASVAELMADTDLSYTVGAASQVAVGDLVSAGAYLFSVAASGSAGNIANSHTTPVQFTAVRGIGGTVVPEQFGEVGTANDSAVLQAAIDSGYSVDFIRSAGYNVGTKLTFNQAAVYRFKNGSSLIYKGDSTTRLADVSANAVFIDPVFDGDNRQPSLALVYWSAGSKPQVYWGKTKNLLATTHGNNLTNQMYGLGIDTDNVRDFLVFQHRFDTIKSHNDTATITTPTEGWGFCGGAVLIPPTGTTATAAYTAYTTGKFVQCEFVNIQTIRDTGLSTADFIRFDDGDGIRIYGDNTYHTECDVLIDSCEFEDCSKRAVKSALRGVHVRDIRIASTGAVPYPMSSLVKLHNDNLVDGIEAEMRTSAREVQYAVQAAVAPVTNSGIRAKNVYVDYAYVGMEVIGLTSVTSAQYQDILFDGFTCPNISLRAFNESSGGVSPPSVEDGITLDNIDVTGRGVSPVFFSGSNALHVKKARAKNMSVKLLENSRIDDLEVAIADTAFTGVTGQGALELGGTAGARVGRLVLDMRGFGATAWPGGTTYLGLITGTNQRIEDLILYADSTALVANEHVKIYGNDLHVGRITNEGPGTISFGRYGNTSRASIGRYIRKGSSSTTVTALMMGDTTASAITATELAVGELIDLRPCSTHSARLLSGATKAFIGVLTSKSTSGAASLDDTAGQLTIGHTLLWP